MNKKLVSLVLVMMLAMATLFGCGQQQAPAPEKQSTAQAAAEVPTQYMTAQDLNSKLGDKTYKLLDVRKAEDFQKSHIPGAISADMDAAKNGDMAKGVETMKNTVGTSTDNLVLICYSGKSYAEASTKALREMGYDMTKVYTLEGGMKAWDKDFSDKLEK